MTYESEVCLPSAVRPVTATVATGAKPRPVTWTTVPTGPSQGESAKDGPAGTVSSWTVNAAWIQPR
ncbi:hypothetical protein [Streptomyces sp. NBC_01217]|uniref:hypothetical protein n=1 Tax=Streptomyces sp. NBC_01217 TaxID=2903779 RepID=UPI002E0F8180|nr:hypothetical protein OG507_14925 [Streptomyces sp. NBC_01217]